MSATEHLTHGQMEQYYSEMIRGMAMSQYLPDVIVGPMRGGADIGIKLSHYFGVPFIAILWQTKDGNLKDVSRLNEVLKLHKGKNVLIVDDICDSGQTLTEICAITDTFRHDVSVDFATAILNMDCEFEGVSWSGRHIYRNVDTQWFIFPWEEWWMNK